MSFKLFFSLLLSAGVLLAAMSCTKKIEESASVTDPSSTSQSASNSAADRGKKIYMANCIACHNVNPKQDGGIGPANWGSSRELLHAKVIMNTYPAGYTPKRPSKAMAPLPHLEKDIDDLAAFLNAQ